MPFPGYVISVSWEGMDWLYLSSFSVYPGELIVFCLTAFLGGYSWFVFKLVRNKPYHYISAETTDRKTFDTEMSTILEFKHFRQHAPYLENMRICLYSQHVTNTVLGTEGGDIDSLFSWRWGHIFSSLLLQQSKVMSSRSVLMYGKSQQLKAVHYIDCLLSCFSRNGLDCAGH